MNEQINTNTNALASIKIGKQHEQKAIHTPSAVESLPKLNSSATDADTNYSAQRQVIIKALAETRRSRNTWGFARHIPLNSIKMFTHKEKLKQKQARMAAININKRPTNKPFLTQQLNKQTAQALQLQTITKKLFVDKKFENCVGKIAELRLRINYIMKMQQMETIPFKIKSHLEQNILMLNERLVKRETKHFATKKCTTKMQAPKIPTIKVLAKPSATKASSNADLFDQRVLTLMQKEQNIPAQRQTIATAEDPSIAAQTLMSTAAKNNCLAIKSMVGSTRAYTEPKTGFRIVNVNGRQMKCRVVSAADNSAANITSTLATNAVTKIVPNISKMKATVVQPQVHAAVPCSTSVLKITNISSLNSATTVSCQPSPGFTRILKSTVINAGAAGKSLPQSSAADAN